MTTNDEDRPRTLRVTCPDCGGLGVITEKAYYGRGPKSYDLTEDICGCGGSGEILVKLNWEDERREFPYEDGRTVQSSFPPFHIDGRLFIYETSGDTVEIYEEDLDD